MGQGHFWSQGQNSNKLGRGPLGDTIVELLNLCLDDRIGLSGMLVYHLLYIFSWYSQVLHVSS